MSDPAFRTPLSEERTDEALAFAAQKGDEGAEEALFARYDLTLKRLANRYYLQGAEKEDVAQEILWGFFRAIQTYREGTGAKFSSFAHTCIHRKLASAMEKANALKHRALADYEPLNGEEVGGADDPADVFFGKETRREIDALLTPAERAALALFVQGFRVKEIAGKLKKTEKSVENTIQRVRKKVSLYLGERAD